MREPRSVISQLSRHLVTSLSPSRLPAAAARGPMQQETRKQGTRRVEAGKRMVWMGDEKRADWQKDKDCSSEKTRTGKRERIIETAHGDDDELSLNCQARKKGTGLQCRVCSC